MTALLPLLVILGPTAVGKSGLALDLARRLGGEIVSADSAQVYRGMDIGTDKPPPAVTAGVPHHLLDVRDPDEGFSVSEFITLAREAIAGIAGRDRLPILAGGTGLYIRALTAGYELPPAAPDPALRAELAREAAEAGPEAVFRRLQALDPEAAARVDPRNVRRVIRAVEVALSGGTGVPPGGRPAGHGAAQPYDALKIGLTRDRDDLYQRIDARVDEQLARGLMEEVRRLLARGYPPDLPAFQALGYKEVITYLQGVVDHDEMVRALKRNTRRYAKRQWTWFRREEGVTWFNVTELETTEVVETVCRLASARGWGHRGNL